MDRKDLVEISEIYVKLHHLDKKDEDSLIEKINNSKEEELWSFLSTGGDFKNKLYEFEMGSWLSDKSDKVIGRIWSYIYQDVTGGKWDNTKATISSVYGDVSSGFSLGAKVVAVTILIALIVRASKMIRIKYLSKGSKECKGFSGIQKEICELKKEIMVKRMELGVVKRGLNVCNSTKTPAECKQKLSHRLAGVKTDLSKKQSNLKELMEKAKNKKR